MIMLRIGTLYYFVYNSILHGTEFYEFLQSLATVYESTREMIMCYRYFTKFDYFLQVVLRNFKIFHEI